ncbi:hypothetical protein [Streptomyces sp. NBC_01477]|uniref:hypothetical protein n=1 Tax=Streptomyces sp. NBC_01477 TaxID=2976015 RepID=UPI003FCD2C85
MIRMVVFGAVVAQGRDYRETFQVLLPGFDLAEERSDGRSQRSPSGSGRTTCVRMCDRRCQLCVKPGCGLASPAIRRSVPLGALRALDLPADLIATSDDW